MRNIGVDLARHHDVLFLGLGLDDQKAGFDQGTDVHGLALDLHAARLDLGHIEDAVDQSEEVVGRLFDIAGILVDPDRLRDVEGAKHVGEADDGIERCAQLMAHIGDEL